MEKLQSSSWDIGEVREALNDSEITYTSMQTTKDIYIAQCAHI